MNILQTIIVPFIFIFFFNGTMVLISHKRYGETVPLSLILITMIVYFGQMIFKTFSIGIIACTVVGALFPVLLIYNCIKHKENTKQIIKNIFSSGFYAFCLIYLVFTFIYFKAYYIQYDEFGHWGLAVKEMFRLDKFYSDPAALIWHKDYPPFIAVLELVWCKLSGSYSEMATNMAIHIFALSLLVPPLVENFKQNGFKQTIKNVITSLLLIITYIVVINAFDPENSFYTIYPDMLVAILFTYSMILIINRKAFNSVFSFICVVLALTAAILTKQIGIAFVLITSFYYLLVAILDKNIKLKTILGFLCVLVIPLLNYKIWAVFVASLGVTNGQFSLDNITLAKIRDIIIDKTGGLQHATLSNYLHALFNRAIYTNIFPITYVTALLVVYLFLYGIWKTHQKEISKKDVLGLVLIFLCGTVGYALTMAILYMFCFNEHEMRWLACYNRYLPTYIVGEILILFTLLVELEIKKSKQKNKLEFYVVIALICATLLNPAKLEYFVPRSITGEQTKEEIEIADQIKSNTDEMTNILVMVSNVENIAKPNVSYYASPRIIGYISLSDIEATPNYDFGKLAKEIEKSNYLYIENIDDNFSKNISKYLKPQTALQEKALYKVIYDDKSETLNLQLAN